MSTLTHIAINQGNTLAFQGNWNLRSVGNLVRNGGFENGLVHWKTSNVRDVSGKETHEGQGAAGMGAYRRSRKSAWMFQCIPLPGGLDPLFLQLFFSVAGFRNAPARLDVTLCWFDANTRLIDYGIQASIQRRAIGNGSVGKWNTYTLISDKKPANTSFAVLRFYKWPGVQSKNFLVVDDVSLTPIVSSYLRAEEDPTIAEEDPPIGKQDIAISEQDPVTGKQDLAVSAQNPYIGGLVPAADQLQIVEDIFSEWHPCSDRSE